MRRTWERAGWRTAALAVVASVAVSGCQAQSSIVPAHEDAPVVVIETASFAEAEVIGYIYGNAFIREGWRVQPRPQSGTGAEAVESVANGESTFTVGFTGRLLRQFDPGSAAVAADEVYPAMMAALPEGVTAGDPAPAEDKPALVVSRNTSETHGLSTMSDLAGRCGEFTMGARAEMLADRELFTGISQAYDCVFGRQVALGPNPRVVLDALRSGQIGVGGMRSSDPVLHEGDMVMLDDDADAITAQHLVPVFRKGSLTEDQLALVNRISAELTTDDVRELLLGIEFGSASAVALADFWLNEHGY